MSAQPFSILYPLIRGLCKRAPVPAVDVAILNAAREFCRESKFRQQAVPLDLQAQVQWYPLIAPSDQEEVIGVDCVQYNGHSWPCPIYAGEATENGDGPAGGEPCLFFYEPPNWLVLLRQPTMTLTGGASVQLILQPTQAAFQLDETLTQRYDKVLADGALALLYDSNGSEWEDPRKAEKYHEKFESGCARGSADRDTGFKQRHVLTRVHRF